MTYDSFGAMIDCSRNGVMTVAAVKRFVDIIASFGYNALELYTEDTYEVPGEPYFGYMRGRYTSAELKEIDAYARRRGVELIPCIQTLGHLTALAKNFPLKDMFDVGDILLVGEERTYEFLDRCFAALADSFVSRKVNIGMDEAHLVGLGKYLDRHGYRDRFSVLTEHLSRVAAIAAKYGFTVHMWSDMFFRFINGGRYYGKGLTIPESVLAAVPDNVELTYWDYTSVNKADYVEMMKSHLATGRRVRYAAGAWCWCGFAPLNGFSMRPLREGMAAARECGIRDVIVTMWGDDGKECSYFSMLPALYAARAYADGIFDEEQIKAGFEKKVGVAMDDFMLLDLPNEFDNFRPNVTGYPENPQKWLLYQDPFLGLFDCDLSERGTISYGAHAKRLRRAAARAGEYGYLFTTLADLCRALEIKATLGLRLRAAYDQGDRAALKAIYVDCKRLIGRLERFYRSFSAQWNAENKPFGWEVQDARLGGLVRRIKTCMARLDDYLTGKIDRIEELETCPLSVMQDDLHERSYTRIFTRGRT